MTLYIVLVLLLAGAQSFCKLSLLPRKWGYCLTAPLLMLPFCFESAIASSSMQQVNAVLSSAATLERWCALAVIQELLVLTAGFSLLAEESARRELRGLRQLLHRCKFAVFLPSVLTCAGILYFQMYLFNRFPGLNFRSLSFLTALAVGAAAAGLSEVMRFLRRDREQRLLTVLHLEYFLLFPAVFLPVAASAEFVDDGTGSFAPGSLLPPLFLSGAAGVAGVLFYAFFKIKLRRKFSCQR